MSANDWDPAVGRSGVRATPPLSHLRQQSTSRTNVRMTR